VLINIRATHPHHTPTKNWEGKYRWRSARDGLAKGSVKGGIHDALESRAKGGGKKGALRREGEGRNHRHFQNPKKRQDFGKGHLKGKIGEREKALQAERVVEKKEQDRTGAEARDRREQDI